MPFLLLDIHTRHSEYQVVQVQVIHLARLGGILEEMAELSLIATEKVHSTTDKIVLLWW